MAVADLRGILHYVPQFRGETFVVSVDGAVLASPAQAQLMVDLSSLHSLDIRLVLVFGARQQIDDAAEAAGVTPSNSDGTGPTDDTTLKLCLSAINSLSGELMRGLTTVGLRAANANAVHARTAGIVNGTDYVHTGRIEEVDTGSLKVLLDEGMIPLVAPLTYDRSGNAIRLNSDSVAVSIARALDADKIIYLCEEPNPRSLAPTGGQIPAADALALADRLQSDGFPSLASKFRHASRASKGGVRRVHLIDGNDSESLLSELFSNEGVGAMVYADEYLLIRPGERADIPEILTLIEGAVENGFLLERTHEDIEAHLSAFSILEVDGNAIGCVALHPQATDAGSPKMAELACLFVRRSHEGLGYGTRLLQHAESSAEKKGITQLFTLTTGAVPFFEEKGGFDVGPVDRLPETRRTKLDASGRGSRVLYKQLK